MRTLRLALAGLLVALGLVALAPAAPSFACSCAVSSPAQHLRGADAVFTGTLADVAEQPPAEDGTVSSMDPTVYTFDVDRVLQGEVPTTTEVQSARFGASCGLEGMQPGQTYIVFATAGRTRLEANLCGGTRATSAPYVDRIAELAGAEEAGGTSEAAGGAAEVAAVLAALLSFLGITVT